jgi:hypothetical protein
LEELDSSVQYEIREFWYRAVTLTHGKMKQTINVRSDEPKRVHNAATKWVPGPIRLWRGPDRWNDANDRDLILETKRDLDRVSLIEYGDFTFYGWPERNRLKWDATDDVEANVEIRRLISRGPSLWTGAESVQIRDLKPGEKYGNLSLFPQFPSMKMEDIEHQFRTHSRTKKRRYQSMKSKDRPSALESQHEATNIFERSRQRRH